MTVQQRCTGNRVNLRPNSAYIQSTGTREERGLEPMGLDGLRFEAVDVAFEEE